MYGLSAAAISLKVRHRVDVQSTRIVVLTGAALNAPYPLLLGQRQSYTATRGYCHRTPARIIKNDRKESNPCHHDAPSAKATVPLIARAATAKEEKTTARLLLLTGENADTVTDLAARNAASAMARGEFSGPRL
jgi:hypothetical protein